MNRNMKLLVMLGAAVLAFTAMAPAASAWKFRKQEAAATVKALPDGKNKIKWTFALSTMECLETGAGTSEATESTEEVVALTAEECNVGEVQVKPVLNGCSADYVSGLVNFIGTTSIICPPGKKLEFQFVGCTVTMSEQKGLSSVTFKNIPNGGAEAEKEVTAEFKVANLKYEEDNVAPGNTCSKPGVLQENGAINGPELLTAENAKMEMKGFWVV